MGRSILRPYHEEARGPAMSRPFLFSQRRARREGARFRKRPLQEFFEAVEGIPGGFKLIGGAGRFGADFFL